MKKLLEFLVCSIVQEPKEVSVVEESLEEGTVVLTIKVHPDDIKIVIGKGGKTIRALRELVKILAIKEKKQIQIKVDR